MSFLGLRIHRCEPDNPTKIRAYTGTLLTKDSVTEGRNNYADHEIAHWYGVSFKLKWFLGFWVFGETAYPSEQGPIPYR